MIRLVVVDDNEIVLGPLVSLLNRQDGLEVVGTAHNGRKAVEVAAELRPDVMVMDVSMPVMDGIEATREIKHACPQIKVIGYTSAPSSGGADLLLAAGAETVLDKAEPVAQLIGIIRQVCL